MLAYEPGYHGIPSRMHFLPAFYDYKQPLSIQASLLLTGTSKPVRSILLKS